MDPVAVDPVAVDPVAGVRTAVLGGCCALLTVAGHVVGGGHPPSAGACLGVALASVALAAATARVRWTPGLLTMLLAGSQLGAHALLGAYASGGGHAAATSELTVGPGMLTGHLLAAGTCAVVLTRADASWTFLLAVLGWLAVAAGLRTTTTDSRLGVPAARALPARERPAHRARPLLLAYAVSRRGPPSSPALDPAR